MLKTLQEIFFELNKWVADENLSRAERRTFCVWQMRN